MKYLRLEHVFQIHRRVIETSGGDSTILDRGKLESAIAQPRMSFGGEALDPTLADKAAALGFSLINNHPFLDGNKRTGIISIHMFNRRNGYDIRSDDDDEEAVVLGVASGVLDREEFKNWIRRHLKRLKGG